MIPPWILYSIGSGLSFALMAIVYKKVFSFGITPFILNLFVFGFAFLAILGVNLVKGDITIPSKYILLFILLGTLCFLMGNLLYIYAISTAPNPGFATALKATEILFTTSIAVLLFRSHITWSNALGILLIFIGVFLVIKK